MNQESTKLRDRLPIGTVRVRKKHGKGFRLIKVNDDEPASRRWMTFARHWWMRNRGPIPEGMRVVHRNGDPLDDSPENLILATAGDVAYLAREWYPGLDEVNKLAVQKAMRKHNRERAAVRRAFEYLPNHFYPVDVPGRRVINEPYRSRARLFRAVTGHGTRISNGRGLVGHWLGWPGMPQVQAEMLAILAQDDSRSLSVDELLDGIKGLRTLHAWGREPRRRNLIANGTCHLKNQGLIVVVRGGRRGSRYRISGHALNVGTIPVPFVAALGKTIDDRFPGFEKVWPDGKTVRKSIVPRFPTLIPSVGACGTHDDDE